ncbi:MAG: hypothetical protein JWM71_2184 [Solirubrobacteraceae bacterium]|nr:hypothetical protein [Solirubrobacteraceae bacterium]
MCAIVLAVSQSAGAATLLPPSGKIFTGVAMGSSLTDFEHRTGQKPQVWEQFVAWNHSYQWAINLARDENTRLMLHLSTAPGQDQAGSITPGDIAAGRGDHWLVSLRGDLAAFGKPVYLRFLGEMNNCHNAYAPLSCSGASRGSRYSSATFVQAWRRTAVIMRGTSRQEVNTELRRLHQHALRTQTGDFQPAQIAMVWSPMTGGSPMVSALDPGRFWPGRHWVDWVATSFYSKFPNFRWLTPYYQRFSQHQKVPFMFAEWAMWENPSPSFVTESFSWIRSHPRTKMLVYNQGKNPDGPFRLKYFPAAAQALRHGLSGSIFTLK